MVDETKRMPSETGSMELRAHPSGSSTEASASSETEERLRSAVAAIRRDNPGLVAKQVHAALLAQGEQWADTTISEVKRMCSKVAKADVLRQTASLGGPLGHLLPTEDAPKTAEELLRDIRQDPSQRDADAIKEERPGLGHHMSRHRGDRLGTAAERGDTQQVVKLLKKGVDPNFQNAASLVTPLGVACERGHLGVVGALLDARADPELATREGYRPIHAAAQFGKHRVVSELVERGGCDVDAPCPLHDTFPLWIATYFNHLETVDVLLRAGADPMAVRRAAAPTLGATLGGRAASARPRPRSRRPSVAARAPARPRGLRLPCAPPPHASAPRPRTDSARAARSARRFTRPSRPRRWPGSSPRAPTSTTRPSPAA